MTDVYGVSKARIDFDAGKVQVSYDDEKTNADEICRSLKACSDGRYTAKPLKVEEP
ncbi:hypothetical protein IV102_13855 [bacterium]|nr:hypothetical protein [bacterium]